MCKHSKVANNVVPKILIYDKLYLEIISLY